MKMSQIVDEACREATIYREAGFVSVPETHQNVLQLNQPACFFFFRMVSSSRTCMMSPIHSPWALRWLPAWQLCVVVWDASVHLYHSEYKSCLLLTSRRWPSLLLQVQPLHRYNDILCLEEYTVFFWYKVNYKNAVMLTVTHSANVACSSGHRFGFYQGRGFCFFSCGWWGSPECLCRGFTEISQKHRSGSCNDLHWY